MFHRSASAVIVAAFAALCGGCGTMINQSSDPGQAFYSDQLPARLPYGGVMRDLAAPPSGIYQAATAGEDGGVIGRAQMLAAAVLIPPIDLPISLVADTLFLPFDVAHQFGWEWTDSPSSQGGNAETKGATDAGNLADASKSR
jgi:uncharacterized protein YceK